MAEQAKVAVTIEPKAATPAAAPVAAPAIADAPKPAVAAKDAAPVARAAVAKAAKAAAVKKTITKKTMTKTVKKPVIKVAAKVAAPATPFQKIKEKTMSINETIKQQAETAISQGKATVEQIQAKAKEAMDQGAKSLEEVNSFNRGNLEALVEAGRVAAKGVEEMTAQVVEIGKKNAEATTAALRSFTGAKSANELFQLQSDFARTQFDKFVADGSKLTEMFVKFAGETFEPISNRFAVAADKVAKAAAR